MPYYSELSDIMNNIIGEKMLRNKELCKLLVCYNTECGDTPCVTCPNGECPFLQDTNKLFMTHIYPIPKIIDAKTEKGAYLGLNLTGGYETTNTAYKNLFLYIDICVHDDIILTADGKYRQFEILHQIDKMLNNQWTDLPVYGKPQLRGYQYRSYAEHFHGIQVQYQLTINSNIECNPKGVDNIANDGLAYDPEWTDSHCCTETD